MQGNTDFLDSEDEDLEVLKEKHEKLVNQILKEEDDLLNLHWKEIDDTVDLVKKEMVLIHEVDKPGSDVDDYI